VAFSADVVSADVAAVAAALPHYDVGAELGHGGWGIVLSGRHRQLDRQVAIKQLPAAFAAEESVRRRFFVEAKLMASLDHPHIVPVYDFVEQDGLCLLVLELLPGGTVWSRFTSDGFTPTAAAAIGLACLAGLQAAHAKNFLHRDIKPENLMFSANGVLKVTDFGIAKMIGGEETLATRAGEVIGTPAYIAPEQARGGALSPATDIYAVATMLYELFSGVLPFADDGDPMTLLFRHAFESPDPLRDKAPQLPRPITEVVMAGLATDPLMRPASAEQFGLSLARACTTSWGPGWLAAEATPVMGAGSLVAATETTGGQPTPRSGYTAPATVMAGALGSIPPPPAADGSIPPPPGAPPRTPGATTATPTTPAVPAAPAVHPLVTVHAGGPALAQVGEPVDELVPLRDVVVPPPAARWPFLAAAVLLVATVLLAFAGLGSPTRGGTLAAGEVSVAGLDPTTGQTIPLNLSKPVPVTVGPSGPQADAVTLGLSMLGHQVTSGSAELAPGATRDASVDLGGHYFLSGAFTGTLTLLAHGTAVAHESFGVHTGQSGAASVAGVVPFVLLLFVAAYAESLLRSMRRGKRKISGPVGLTVVGALLGLDLVGLAWVLTKHEPTVTALIVCVLLGAGTGFVAALGATRLGRQRLFQRAQRRERRQGRLVAT
jgi:serine/threonine-protein kinase